MMNTSFRRFALGSALAVAAGAMIAAPAMAQRDPAYAAARASGSIGESFNGMLGIVGASTPDLERVVRDINNQRRDVYVQRAQATGVTLEQYALIAGCQAITRTEPGEKYQTRDGTWHTRTTEAPLLDPSCP